MARNGLPLLVCALLCTLTPPLTHARPDETKDNRIETLLKVNRALGLGRDYLRSGQYQSAVNVLEGGLPAIDGNQDYLKTLGEAYRALIGDLRRQHRDYEIAAYQQRLDHLVGTLKSEPGPTVSVPPPPRIPQVPTAPSTVQVPTAPATLAVSPPPAAPAQPTASKTAAITARGVPAEDPLDPFSEANSKQPELARKYLVKAESEFASGHYLLAGGLYDQAFRADDKCLGDLGEARVRWAYCRLVDIRETMNRPSPPPSGDLERQIRQAMSLAPSATQLTRFGEDLLLVVQKRGNQGSATSTVDQTAAIPLRHTPRVQGAAWAIVDTTNFRIYHNLDQETATQVARKAEAVRTAASNKWFGGDGGPWNPRCEMYLHATGQEYTAETGQPVTCPGHSKVAQEGERVISRRIDIHVDANNWTTGVLPHETTHVVLAGHFGPRPLPRWADEGMAVLAEPRELVQRHLANLPQHRQDQQLFTLRDLLKLDNYPEPRLIGAFYAESVSLVDFLSRQPGGPQKFSAFLRDGLRSGYDASLKQHYGLNSLQELEGYWTRFAFQEFAAQPSTSGYDP